MYLNNLNVLRGIQLPSRCAVSICIALAMHSNTYNSIMKFCTYVLQSHDAR